ncbi:MAG: hypothetical protein ABIJ56_11075 [Pseudomonadota bacterium]
MEKHLRINAILMVIMSAAHGLMLLSVFINLILSYIANQPGRPLGDVYPVPPGTPERIGFFGTFAALGLWCSAGIVWAPLNAYGLFKKRAWARTSSLVYYAVSLFTCCCIPLGLYGLWSLSGKDIRPGMT